MGYDLHITRADHWNRNEGSEIDSGEWKSLVAEDPELAPDPEHGEFSVTWTRVSDQHWFDWSCGNVFTTDPDRAVVGKMLQMAERLKAKVQGDDGEDYRALDDWSERAPP